jgi:hypothetical protein
MPSSPNWYNVINDLTDIVSNQQIQNTVDLKTPI